ncbi:MAG: hypothetical protein LBS00_05915, partial [Synergistaceae bacterium]|nr:hypothetical protein [Synergistaceae bacterium]
MTKRKEFFRQMAALVALFFFLESLAFTNFGAPSAAWAAEEGETRQNAAEGVVTAAALTGDMFSGGDGTEGNPYIIDTAAQLAGLAQEVNNGNDGYGNDCGGVYFKLGGDIALTGNWTPIGNSANPFMGVFDGGGHKITGLNIPRSMGLTHAGLFGYIQYFSYYDSESSSYKDGGGTIKNLSVEIANGGAVWAYSISESSIYAGGIVAYGSGHIINCHVSGSVRTEGGVSSAYAGGVVGQFFGYGYDYDYDYDQNYDRMSRLIYSSSTGEVRAEG